MNNRKQPYLEDVEKSILGAVLLDTDVISTVAQLIKPAHFYKRNNKNVYQAMLNLLSDDEPIDPITVFEQLKKDGKLTEFNNAALYLSKLSESIETHCKLLIEKWMLRRHIAISDKLKKMAYSETEDPFEITSKAINYLEDIMKVREVGADEQNFYDRLPQLYKNFEDERNGKLEGTIKCDDFPSLNRATGGLKPGNLVVISGKYKGGKTRFAFSLLRDFAVNKNISVGLIGLEMTQDEYDKILLSMQTGTRYQYLRDPQLKNKDGRYQFRSDAMIDMVNKAAESFKGTQIYISDSIIYDIELMAKIRYWNHKHGVKIIMVDYLQLIQTSKKYERRDLEIAEYSRNLKNLARQLGIIIIAIVQENERGESADSKAPLKDSDFWFSVDHPVDSGKESVKMGGHNISIDQSHFRVILKASRHTENNQRWLNKFFENGEYKEFDYTYQYEEVV